MDNEKEKGERAPKPFLVCMRVFIDHHLFHKNKDMLVAALAFVSDTSITDKSFINTLCNRPKESSSISFKKPK